MDISEALAQRRSVREFTDRAVDRDVLAALAAAAVQAPSAMNEQPWHFTIVTDRELLKRISAEAKAHLLRESMEMPLSGHFRDMLADPRFDIFYGAPALIVISAPKGARWAVEDCALAAENLMLEAWARGLGSCWIGFAQDWLSSEAGRAMLEIPVSHTAVAPIIVGHPKGKVQPVPRRSPSIRWMGAGRGALAA